LSYIKANDLLPPELVKEIQKYIQGTQIYIPRKQKKRLGWGQKNGTRQKLNQRNTVIRALKKSGRSIAELAELYHLSTDGIRKIVY
jgi:Mor family transcriptional regulator